VATPFTYAREVLADGRGLLVPFGDPAAIRRAVVALLACPAARARIERRAGDLGRGWQWPQVGAAYARELAAVAPGLARGPVPQPGQPAAWRLEAVR
jgi:glycosyltransferase involved in cell wall biosynthesis